MSKTDLQKLRAKLKALSEGTPEKLRGILEQPIVKRVNEDDKTAEVVVSSVRMDRDHEVILPSAYEGGIGKHVPMVASHNYWDLLNQIGEWSEWEIRAKELRATGKWYTGLGNPRADWGWTLAQLGKAAFSVGFMPIEWDEIDWNDDEEVAAVAAGKKPWRTYTRVELLEVSQVVVPSNREALQRQIAKSVGLPWTVDDIPAIATALALPETGYDDTGVEQLTAEQLKQPAPEPAPQAEADPQPTIASGNAAGPTDKMPVDDPAFRAALAEVVREAVGGALASVAKQPNEVILYQAPADEPPAAGEPVLEVVDDKRAPALTLRRVELRPENGQTLRIVRGDTLVYEGTVEELEARLAGEVRHVLEADEALAIEISSASFDPMIQALGKLLDGHARAVAATVSASALPGHLKEYPDLPTLLETIAGRIMSRTLHTVSEQIGRAIGNVDAFIPPR